MEEEPLDPHATAGYITGCCSQQGGTPFV